MNALNKPANNEKIIISNLFTLCVSPTTASNTSSAHTHYKFINSVSFLNPLLESNSQTKYFPSPEYTPFPSRLRPWRRLPPSLPLGPFSISSKIAQHSPHPLGPAALKATNFQLGHWPSCILSRADAAAFSADSNKHNGSSAGRRGW